VSTTKRPCDPELVASVRYYGAISTLARLLGVKEQALRSVCLRGEATAKQEDSVRLAYKINSEALV
jgi:hypothetical protein